MSPAIFRIAVMGDGDADPRASRGARRRLAGRCNDSVDRRSTPRGSRRGRGTRLARNGDRPKGFLRLGEQPIIVESIRRLVAHGIREVVIVTGHAAADYEELARSWPAVIRTVHNERFAESGSMVSLDRAAALTSGPFLLLESDLVYEPRALAVLLEYPAPDAVLLSGPTAAGDEVFVATRRPAGGHVKDRALTAPAAGELVGIEDLGGTLRADAHDRRGGLHTAVLRLRPTARGRARVADPPHVPMWGEIDDARHLRRAEIYPAIAALDRALPSDAASG